MPTRKSPGAPRRPAGAPLERHQPEVDLAGAGLLSPDLDALSAAPQQEAARPLAPAPVAERRSPLYPVGFTLFPLAGESQGYGDWYARDVEPELALAETARFALVRVLVSWKLLEPQVGQYSEAVLGRLGEVVAAAHAHRQRVIVCFFADDRQADLADVAWGRRRDPRTDAYLVQRELALVQRVVQELRSEPNVFAWQLADEAFCSGFRTSGELEAWTRQMREAVRELDPDRPITLGADAETLFRATGVDARAAIATCEFAVAHTTAAYRAYAAQGPITSGPATYLDAFLLRLAQRGAPVVADGVGVLTLDNSAKEEAAAVRMTLWSGLANGASSALVRRLRDFSTERREPYLVDQFETLVGLADAAGEPKPAFREAAAFVRSAARIGLDGYDPVPERTAVLVPAERYTALPDLAGLYAPRSCFAAFIAAKEAHVPVTLAEETGDLSAFSAIVVPSAFALQEETWERLGGFLRAGGSLALSYGGGDTHPALRELFGVDFLGDAGPRDSISCRVAQPGMLGEFDNFDAALPVPNFALFAGVAATVVATDALGNPLLTVNHVGQGRAVCIAAPLERALARGDAWMAAGAVRRMLREVYGALARDAGCGAPLGCGVPEVEVALLQGRSDDVAILINHADIAVTATLTADRVVASVVDVGGGEPADVGSTTFAVPLAANGAMALRLTYR